jgi:hypothetical protein
VTTAIQVKKRYGTKQPSTPAECHYGLRVNGEIPVEDGFRDLNSGNETIGHIGEPLQLVSPSGLYFDVRAAG